MSRERRSYLKIEGRGRARWRNVLPLIQRFLVQLGVVNDGTAIKMTDAQAETALEIISTIIKQRP